MAGMMISTSAGLRVIPRTSRKTICTTRQMKKNVSATRSSSRKGKVNRWLLCIERLQGCKSLSGLGRETVTGGFIQHRQRLPCVAGKEVSVREAFYGVLLTGEDLKHVQKASLGLGIILERKECVALEDVRCGVEPVVPNKFPCQRDYLLVLAQK